MTKHYCKVFVLALSLTTLATGCGGGSSSGPSGSGMDAGADDGSNSNPDSGMVEGGDMTPPQEPEPSPAPEPEPEPPVIVPPTMPTLPVLPTLEITELNLAQTHVISPDGKRWEQTNRATIELHQVGGRPALALVELTPTDVENVQVEGRVGNTSLGSVALSPNSDLPQSESGGPRYSETARPATLPADWLQPGLELRLNATAANASDWQPVVVGAPVDFLIRSLPFYLFGADETLVSVDQASAPNPAALDEIYAKWPVTELAVDNHPAERVDWPQLVIPPRNGNPAYVMNSADDRLNGFDPISSVRSSYGAMRGAAGESDTANQYYAALIQANADGSFRSAGGGLGGGHVGAGDHRYTGIFIHEQGHAFGLPHAGESFDADSGYPYPGGSLNGSEWSFDEPRQLFQPVIVPSDASRFAGCADDTFGGTPRQVDAIGRCIRQDPMQSGSGDQADGDQYSTFADYHAGRMQRYFEGLAIDNGDGTRSYDGGRVFVSTESSTGFRRWDSIAQIFVEFDPGVERNKGLYGVRNGYPIAMDVPVYTLVITRSNANTEGATQIYPIIGPYDGNLITTFDPTNADDRAQIIPNTSQFPWYCRLTGCDFTARVTYTNGTIRHFGFNSGFRSFFTNGEPPPESASDPLNNNSFRIFALNVPADSTIARVELLDTPKFYEGVAANPSVLAVRNVE